MSARFPSPWTVLFELVDVIAEGIDKAAEMLCPVDHTAVRRAQAAADALADAEAEVDHLEPFRGPHVRPGDVVGVAMPDGSIRTTYYQPEHFGGEPPLSDAQVAMHNDPCESRHRLGYVCTQPTGHDGDHVAHGPMHQVITQWPQTSRAEGTQHADAPGEVSRGPLAAEPSPGISVSREDLTARIVASKWGGGQHLGFCEADRIASDLLSDYTITKK